MEKIQLSKSEWQYDPSAPLGEKGGFGEVFIGHGSDGAKVAVKKLLVSANDAAHRELRIADELSQLSLSHIIPVFDAGQDARSDSYFVVMALAEGSLQHAIDRVGTFTDADAVAILSDIASGLSEVRQFVHRDLKPLNVLKHEGRWKIADFGIARFVEEATAINTLKYCLSMDYAAPEQWNIERATSATDIYALGCIAYSLINGRPPFNGPEQSDFKTQHTQEVPPSLKAQNPRLVSLVSMMLRKDAHSRPNIERVISVLNGIATELSNPPQNPQGGLAALAQAGAAAAEKSLRQQAAEAAQSSKEQKREILKSSAVEALQREVIEPLFKRIEDVANAERIRKYALQLGTAKLEYMPPTHSLALVEGALQMCKWDVIALAEIAVVQGDPQPYVWSASLLYTDKGENSGYRWYELQFMTSPLLKTSNEFEPFAFNDLRQIDMAINGLTGGPQLATRPKPIDDENFPEFQERWAELFAKAFGNQISWPSMLPLESTR